MKATLQKSCELFTVNRQELKETFKMENDSLISVCASVLTSSGQKVDRAKIKGCRELLKAQTGIFSNFRGAVEMPIVTMLATKEEPAAKLSKSLQFYNILKEKLFGSEYLVLAASILADSVSEDRIGTVATRTKTLYKLMKEDHPFLTSGEDSVFAAMMAVSAKTDALLADEAEAAYRILKTSFSSGNDVQTVAFILALAEGTVEAKCQKLISLYQALTNAGVKYGKYYELSALASLSLLPVDVETLVEDILAVNAYLAEEKAYKGIFGIDKKTRLMHAAMIVGGVYSESTDTNMGALTGTLAMIAAQQAALCAAICASTIAASSAASSN